MIRKLLTVGFILINLSPTSAHRFYDKGKDLLESNISDSEQLIQAYFSNREYIQKLKETVGNADSYILAPKGSGRDVKLTGDAEKMRLEQLIAATLTTPDQETSEIEQVSFKENPGIYNNIVEKCGLETYYNNYQDTIYKTLKGAKRINVFAKIAEPEKWTSRWDNLHITLTSEEKTYIQQEYKAKKKTAQAVKKTVNPVALRFLQRDVDGHNEERHKDRIACLATTLFVDGWKAQASQGHEELYEDLVEGLQQSMMNRLHQMPSAVKQRFEADYGRYEKQINLFLERKVYPLLTGPEYFVSHWKTKTGPNTTQTETLDAEYARRIQTVQNFYYANNSSYSWASSTNKDHILWGCPYLSTEEKVHRLRKADEILEQDIFNNARNKNEIKADLIALPVELMKMFDPSLGLLPPSGNVQTIITKISSLSVSYRAQQRHLRERCLTTWAVVDFAQDLAVGPYWPRLNNQQNFSLDDVQIPKDSRELTRLGEQVASEVERFFNQFDYENEDALNYLAPELLANDHDEANLHSNRTKKQAAAYIQTKLIEQVKKVITPVHHSSQGNIYDVNYSPELKSFMIKFFIKFYPKLKEFNDSFTTTNSSMPFIGAMMNLCATLNNCHGGQSEAVKSTASALFYGKASTAAGGGEIMSILDTFLPNFVKGAFDSCLPIDAHERGRLANAFRNKGIYNAPPSPSETILASNSEIAYRSYKLVSNLWGTKIPEYVFTLVESIEDRALNDYITGLKTLLRENEKAVERQQKKENAPEKLEQLKKAKEEIEKQFKMQETLLALKKDAEERGDTETLNKLNALGVSLNNPTMRLVMTDEDGLLRTSQPLPKQMQIGRVNTQIHNQQQLLNDKNPIRVLSAEMITRATNMIKEGEEKVKKNKEERPLSLKELKTFMTKTLCLNSNSEEYKKYFTYNPATREETGLTLLGATRILERMGWMYRADYPNNFINPTDQIKNPGIWTVRGATTSSSHTTTSTTANRWNNVRRDNDSSSDSDEGSDEDIYQFQPQRANNWNWH